MTSTEVAVEKDVRLVAEYFTLKYNSLEEAIDRFYADDHRHDGDEEDGMDAREFEQMLSKLGVKVDDPHELFDHIDIDCSGRIRFDELFHALQAPTEEVRQNEAERQAREDTKMYQELARKIHTNYEGKIENVFKEITQNKDHFSRADFKRLLEKVHMELGEKMRERLFNKIDSTGSVDGGDGVITMTELSDAMSVHLARSQVLAIAEYLIEKRARQGELGLQWDDAISTEFDMANADTMQRRGSFVDGSLPPVPPGQRIVFEKVLHKLKVIPEVIKDPVHLYTMLRKESITNVDELKKFVIQKYGENEKEWEKLQAKRRKARHDEKMRKAIAKEGRAKKEIDIWKGEATEAAKQMKGEMPNRFTRNWEAEARVGKAQVQLHEYLHGLRKCIRESEEVVAERQRELQYHGGTWDDSPKTPYTPQPFNKSPFAGGDILLDQTSRQQKKAVKADYLIQAASIGDVAKVKSLLHRGANINTFGWGGVTALMAAARHGREAVCRTLVLSHADLTYTDIHGRTVVDHARAGPVAQRNRISQWLQSQGAMSGLELAAQVDALAQRFFDTERQAQDLEAKTKEEASLHRSRTRIQLSRARSVPADVRENMGVEPVPSFGLPEFRDQLASCGYDSMGYTGTSPPSRRPPPLIPGPRYW